MSTEITKEIVCPQCGEPQKYRLYSSINAGENPDLKQMLLDETPVSYTHLPRKKLGYCTPEELFEAFLDAVYAA